MNTLIAALSTLMLCFAGFSCLALAMDRHYEQVSGEPSTIPTLRLTLRLGAAVLGMAGLAACLQGWGTAVGSLVWLGMLSCGALGVAMMLSYRPSRLVGTACAAAVTGLALAVVARFVAT